METLYWLGIVFRITNYLEVIDMAEKHVFYVLYHSGKSSYIRDLGKTFTTDNVLKVDRMDTQTEANEARNNYPEEEMQMICVAKVTTKTVIENGKEVTHIVSVNLLS